jgi:predicted signal transduction protein with EAL and GGDEF domain
MFPLDGTEGQTLFFAADEALYHAKQGGKNCYRFFDRRSNIAEKAAAISGMAADAE